MCLSSEKATPAVEICGTEELRNQLGVRGFLPSPVHAGQAVHSVFASGFLFLSIC